MSAAAERAYEDHLAPPLPAHPKCRRACAADGRCRVRDGDCVAVARDDCRRSMACFERGLCAPRGGVCVATRITDCRASSRCREDGQCELDVEGGDCDEGKSRRSTALMVTGIAVSGVALIGFVAGYWQMLVGSFDSDESTSRRGQITLLVGGVLGVAGASMTVVGAQEVERPESADSLPELSIGPGTASLRWRF